jgi:hypothetical protein
MWKLFTTGRLQLELQRWPNDIPIEIEVNGVRHRLEAVSIAKKKEAPGPIRITDKIVLVLHPENPDPAKEAA